MKLPDGYLTVTQIAERLGISRVTINRLEARGDIPEPSRLERTNQRLYSEADVEALRAYLSGVRERGWGIGSSGRTGQPGGDGPGTGRPKGSGKRAAEDES
jgi:excisionase family DNA binding protein